jgi:hypothetical protein
MGLFKPKPLIVIPPDPSRYDKFDDDALYNMIEASLGLAEANFRLSSVSDETRAAHLHYTITELENAAAAGKAILRRVLH